MYVTLLILMLLTNIAADFLDKRSAIRADSYSMALWTNSTQFLLLLPLIGLIDILHWQGLVLCLLVALFSAFGRLQWFKALARRGDSLSRLEPLTKTADLLVLIAAFIVFGEVFTWLKGAGGTLMILGIAVLGFENYRGNWRALLTSNIAIILVLVYASSTASITLLYKFLVEQAEPILTIYFFLKIFQASVFLAHAFYTDRLIGSFGKIYDLRIFVFARILQTSAALVYLFVIQGNDLSSIAPIAALGPLLVIGIERLIHAIRPDYDTGASDYKLSIRLLALAFISAGAICLYLG